MSVPAPGELVDGKYELLVRLGVGGMGEVFEARHHVTGRRVAVKLLRTDTKKRDEATRRFLREAQAIGRLEHGHVVEVLDAGIDPSTGAPYIVQSLLRGLSLRKLLRAQPRLSPSLAAALVAPILRGLGAAHAAGIVHRDIKPSNVYLCRQKDDPEDDVVPKIIDFGISKLSEGEDVEASLTTLTASGVVVGTVGYMAPEQAQGHDDVDGRADVWAVGVMLHEMVSGRRPFEASTTAAILLRIVSQDAPRLDALGLDVPAAFADVVRRALARDRADRFAKTGDMLAALEEALGQPLRAGVVHVPGASAAEVLPDDEPVAATPLAPAAATAETKPATPAAAARASSDPRAATRSVAAPLAIFAIVVLALAVAVTTWRWVEVGGASAPDAALAADAATGAPPPLVEPSASSDAAAGPSDEGADAGPTDDAAAELAPPVRDAPEPPTKRPPSRRDAGPRVGAHGAAILGAD